MIKNIVNFKHRNEENIILISNYLLIVYAFLLPISSSLSRTLFSIILVCFLLSGNLKQKMIFAFKDKIIQSLILFYIIHVVWMIGSNNIEMAMFQLKAIKYILYVIIFVSLVKKEFVYKIISAFLLAIFCSEIISYCISLEIIDPIYYATVKNPVPFMMSHIQYSSVLSISLGIVFYLFFKEKNTTLKVFYFLFFLSASINIFIIQSRMGYFLYLSSIFIVLLIIYKKNISKLVVYLMLFIVIGYSSAYTLSNDFKLRIDRTYKSFQQVLNSQDYSTSLGVRVGYHIYSYLALKEDLLLGVGSGDHTDVIREEILKHETVKYNIDKMLYPISSGHNANLHSEYLDTVMQFGLVGLLVFLNIFYQTYKYKQEDRYLKSVQLIILTCMIVISIPSVLFIYSVVGKIITLLLSLTLVLYNSKNEKKQI